MEVIDKLGDFQTYRLSAHRFNRGYHFLDPKGIFKFEFRSEFQFFHTAIVDIFGHFQIDIGRHIHTGFGQGLPQKGFGFHGHSDGIPADPAGLGRIVKTDGIFGTDKDHPVKSLMIKVLGLLI